MSLGSESGQPSGVQEDIEFLVDRVADLDATVEELQETIHEKNQRIDELERRVDELDQRTDMLRIVEAADDLDARQRRIALLQHLKRKAENNGGSASIDQERAEEVLHYPDIHRTTYYSDFQACESMVGDEDVCDYQSDGVEGRLVLDLREERSLPDHINSKLDGGA